MPCRLVRSHRAEGRSALSWRPALAALLFGFSSGGCTPSIGDQCILSTDCSLRGERLCDTSQPGGYCTVFNCRANQCPEEAACVMFNPNVPGCGYNDRTWQRTGRNFCMARCETDSDCRAGYVCADPRIAPWSGFILDNVQSQRVCIPPELAREAASTADAGASGSASGDPPVCHAGSVVTPAEIDAGPPRDAGVDADADVTADGGG